MSIHDRSSGGLAPFRALLLAGLALSGAAQAQLPFAETFETGGLGWITTNGVWETGVPTAGPGQAFLGDQCAATNLDGNHHASAVSRYESPQFVVPALDGEDEQLWFHFRTWFSYSSCDYGVASVGVYDTGTFSWTWTNVGASLAEWSDWSSRSIDLTAFASSSTDTLMKVGFSHHPNNSTHCTGTGYGWAVDDVLVDVMDAPSFAGHFERDWEDLTTDVGVWQIGPPPGGSEPDSAPSGSSIAGTHLGGLHPSGTDSRLLFAAVDLPTITGFEQILLQYETWYSYSSCDYGSVQVRTYDDQTDSWSGWISVGSSVSGSSSGQWVRRQVPLTAYAGERAQLALWHHADNSTHCTATGLGWYVDDLVILHGFPGYWGDLGLALEGSQGEPRLDGEGGLSPGSPVTVELSNAQPGSVMGLVAALDRGMAPFKEGLMVPQPQVIAWPLQVSPAGTVTCQGTWPLTVPPGTELFYQAFIVDPGAPQGWSASNALYALSP